MHVACVPHLHDIPISERHSTRHFKGDKHLAEFTPSYLYWVTAAHRRGIPEKLRQCATLQNSGGGNNYLRGVIFIHIVVTPPVI